MTTIASPIARSALPDDESSQHADGKDVDRTRRSYAFELHTRLPRRGKAEYRYFDFAKAVRR